MLMKRSIFLIVLLFSLIYLRAVDSQAVANPANPPVAGAGAGAAANPANPGAGAAANPANPGAGAGAAANPANQGAGAAANPPANAPAAANPANPPAAGAGAAANPGAANQANRPAAGAGAAANPANQGAGAAANPANQGAGAAANPANQGAGAAANPPANAPAAANPANPPAAGAGAAANPGAANQANPPAANPQANVPVANPPAAANPPANAPAAGAGAGAAVGAGVGAAAANPAASASSVPEANSPPTSDSSIIGSVEFEGTWTSKSNAVFTGPDFYDPVDELLIEPALPGMSFSFTADGFWEQATYQVSGNARDHHCPSAVLIFQHGTWKKLDNDTLILEPFKVDGRQLLSDPCKSKTSVYSRYNQTIIFQKWAVYVDPYHGRYRLDLYQFDGKPLPPLYLTYKPPMMLPTITMNPTATGASGTPDPTASNASLRKKIRRSLENRNRTPAVKKRSTNYDMIWWTGVILMAVGATGFIII